MAVPPPTELVVNPWVWLVALADPVLAGSECLWLDPAPVAPDHEF